MASTVQKIEAIARSERRAISLAYTCLFLEGVIIGWIGPFLPQISRSLNVAIDRAGITVSAVAAGYFVALLVSGEIVHRRGARAAMSVSVGLISAGLFMMALARGLPLLWCGAFLAGLGNGGCDVGSNALVADLNPHRLTSALNYLHLAFGVGALMGPIIAGFALATQLSYSWIFLGGSVATALVAAQLIASPGVPADRASSQESDGRPLMRRPLIWALAAVLFFYVGAETGIGAWLFSYLRAETSVSASIASWIVSLYWLGLVIGRGLGGRLGHRMTAHRLSLIASLLSALTLGGLIALPARGLTAAFLAVLIGVGFGPVFPNVIAIGAARFPSEVGRMTAIVAAMSALGGIAVPWLMGGCLVALGARPMLQVALATIAAMLACIEVADRIGTRDAVEALPPDLCA